MKHVLVVSPIPSHPQWQGNSARIYCLCRLLQAAGRRVHFLYFGMEGLDARQLSAMRQCWDHFYFVQPVGGASPPSFGDYYHIDDWYDERVSSLVEDLCRLWDYDACVVNYVWFSKALKHVPSSVRRIIDTHDAFGDRHLVARAAGLEPTWFYTTKPLEADGLRRADLVIAMHGREKSYFESICEVPVKVVGHVIPQTVLPQPARGSNEKLKVGYLGSGNPFNQLSIRALRQALSDSPRSLESFEYHLAGAICESVESSESRLRTWGRVESASDFYAQMDIIMNPMVGGTGLKVKSLEAMAFGRPLVATRDAMIGITTNDPLHQCQDPRQLVSALAELKHERRLSELARNSTRTSCRYRDEQLAGFREVFP